MTAMKIGRQLSHQNHSFRPKLVICLQFAHALISVLSKRRISSVLSTFVTNRGSTDGRNAHTACAIDLRWPLMTKFCLRCLSCVVYVFNLILIFFYCTVCV